MAMLEVRDLHVHYGVIEAIKGISFEVEQGEVIERGDHDDLLAQKGRYYQLYTGLAELA